TDSGLPERQYREIPNPATQGLYVAIIEALAAPISKEKFIEQMLSLILAKRAAAAPRIAVNGSTSGSGSTGTAPAAASATSRVAPEPRVIHAAGLLLSALPKEFMDLFFIEVDSFTRTDETLLQSSTISAVSTPAS